MKRSGIVLGQIDRPIILCLTILLLAYRTCAVFDLPSFNVDTLHQHLEKFVNHNSAYHSRSVVKALRQSIIFFLAETFMICLHVTGFSKLQDWKSSGIIEILRMPS